MSAKDNTKAITFPKGIPGFEEYKDYMLSIDGESPLAQLESAADQQVGFALLKPQLFFGDYLPKIDLNHEDMELLDITSDDTVDVWSIMTLCLSQIEKSTINLRAPLIINERTGKGMQLILSDEKYSSRQPLFAAASPDDQSTREGAVG